MRRGETNEGTAQVKPLLAALRGFDDDFTTLPWAKARLTAKEIHVLPVYLGAPSDGDCAWLTKLERVPGETEAKKEKPSKGFLTMTRDGLTSAAKTCAEMAPSLLKAATAVAEWFSR